MYLIATATILFRFSSVSLHDGFVFGQLLVALDFPAFIISQFLTPNI